VRRTCASIAAALAVVLPATAGAAPAVGAPIAPGPVSALPGFTGSPFSAQPTAPTIAPQNPILARNPNSNIHDDTWMTDAYQRSGPLGRNPIAFSGSLPASLCGTLTFDSHGRILSVCPSNVAPPVARIIDPTTLAVLAQLAMPNPPDNSGTPAYQNFTGGGYFFLDAKDRIWSATKNNQLWVIAESSSGTRLVKQRSYDLGKVLTSQEHITSALPDFAGRIWFVSKQNGKIGILDPKSGRIRVRRLGEEVENSFAVDRDAIYIVSDKRMYRFSVGRDGRPHVDWRVTYANSGIKKPSQVDAGSGTTPTIMSGGYVAITDNADPMNVVVYRKATRLSRGQKRVVCEVPVFDHGASATENSLITAGRSLVVENNYGYQDPFGPQAGAITQPGFARVDVNRRGTGCRLVWTNRTERAPTVVPKLSTKTGLIYAYTQDADPLGNRRWSWVAISFRTGQTAWKQLAGVGALYTNNYAGIAIGPKGWLYLGVFGGIVALRDGVA
jgi:hypothetical protein